MSENKRDNIPNIGGQAVLEGIMMKNKDRYSVGVRKPNGEIEVEVWKYNSVIPIKALTKIPFVRGSFNFIDSMILGMKALNFSASFMEEEEIQLNEKELKKAKIKDDIIMTFTMILSVVLSILAFMVFPYFVIQLLSPYVESKILQVAIEGVIRIGIFIGYILLISKMEDIRRTFMYHGAEHKCINCLENGWELTVENVRKSSKEHKRCGTSFIFFVLLVSMVCLFFIDVENMWIRLVVRIVMLPFIAGISYELIKWAGVSNNVVIKAMSKPGLLMQELTTKEPNDEMIEVAIKAVEAVLDDELVEDIG